jgi:hypothetical protein
LLIWKVSLRDKAKWPFLAKRNRIAEESKLSLDVISPTRPSAHISTF